MPEEVGDWRLKGNDYRALTCRQNDRFTDVTNKLPTSLRSFQQVVGSSCSVVVDRSFLVLCLDVHEGRERRRIHSSQMMCPQTFISRTVSVMG
jgi:hypothetical protein